MHISIAELEQWAKDVEHTLGTEVHRFVGYCKGKYAEREDAKQKIEAAVNAEARKVDEQLDTAATALSQHTSALASAVEEGAAGFVETKATAPVEPAATTPAPTTAPADGAPATDTGVVTGS